MEAIMQHPRVVEALKAYYELLETGDPRTKDWFLVPTPIPVLLLVTAYFVVIFGGMRLMRDREAFRLNSLICVYNFALVVLNGWICKELVVTATHMNMWTKACNPVDRDPSNDYSMRMAKALWWYFFSKSLEFLDTTFFMLRKKNNQISFLHLYHHSSILLLWWIGIRWAPGGSSYFSATLNSGVHVLMYSYYFVAALGPKYRPYLWWKKHMTKVQLLQFFLIMGNALFGLITVRRDECDFYEWMAWALFLYMVSMITLFGLFYMHAYSTAPKKEAKKNGKKAQ